MTAAEDRERGERLMQLIAPGAPSAWGLTVPGDPPTKARPRFSNGRVYKLEADEEAENRTGWHLRKQFPRPLTGNVALGAVFYRPDLRRIDVDNMLKHVLDAANGIVWLDDSQVTALVGVAELDAEEPRTLIVIAPHVSTLRRGTDNVLTCEPCGEEFEPREASQRYCSRHCAAFGRRRAVRS
ncbi:RusA family crossover junction endodeoxyribonuclease [Streptomyces sp. AMCC400023]|uniref:RusA family crossover junction endodeoxyribonuclease n=1 Tax=Streptomyces sp. AMCC400023 TaxID=2056258 RepID=UPI001F200D2B|nr:RusA family crossover junction endodeoxyribonuclease [Streptomyces sp. AMCC400023]UJV42914.1 hypothetical protein CVT30_26505 [Streptomyces sp. AMCC400023]